MSSEFNFGVPSDPRLQQASPIALAAHHLSLGHAARTAAAVGRRPAHDPPPLLSLVSEHQEQRGDHQISRLAHACAISAVALFDAADGRQHVVSADDDGRLKLWTVRFISPSALVPAGSHRLHSAAINSLALHPPSGLLATAGDDGCVRLWDLHHLLHCAAGQHAVAQRACLAHRKRVSTCCFSSCGGFLASSSQDGDVRLWATGSQQPLAQLQLMASSLAFLPGDDAALLLVAEQGLQQGGPLLLDLREVEACRRYCAAVAVAQAGSHSPVHSSGRGGSRRAGQVSEATLHPAVAMCLPTSPGISGAWDHTAAAATPSQQEQGAASAARQGLGSSGATCRHPGFLHSSGGRRRRRQLEAEEGESEEAAAAAGAAAGRVGSSARVSSANISGWLPDSAAPLRMRPAAQQSWDGWSAWSVPLSPSSPPAPHQDGSVPAAAVAACYEDPISSGGAEWDAASRSFVNRQGGHSMPVCSLLPLPEALHVLTVAVDGEAKLWPGSGSSNGGSASSSSGSGGDGVSSVCCTLLPAACEQEHGMLACHPVLSTEGRFVLLGMPSGTLACWDLRLLARTAHLPVSRKLGNAAAASHWSDQPLTAVALAAGDNLVVAGDAAGRLLLRWR